MLWKELVENIDVSTGTYLTLQILMMFRKFLQTYIPSIPKKAVFILPSDKTFITKGNRRKIHQQNRSILKQIKTPHNSDCQWSKYRCLKNQVIFMVRTAKTKFKQNLTSEILDRSFPPDKSGE